MTLQLRCKKILKSVILAHYIKRQKNSQARILPKPRIFFCNPPLVNSKEHLNSVLFSNWATTYHVIQSPLAQRVDVIRETLV